MGFSLVRPCSPRGICLAWCLIAASAAADDGGGPIRLHADNPHYLLFRNRTTILVTSGEHYGAVLNADFNFVPYLDELQRHGLNLTRTFAGTYREIPGSFKIVENTLAPAAGRFVCPWAPSNVPGGPMGEAKYDLTNYSPAYFQRLKQFLRAADQRTIVVELVLFCTIYDDNLWAVNPMNPANNTSNLGPIARQEAYALKDERLSALQEALARKIVTELNDFDNLYYEVCNEPYIGGVTPAWNDRMVRAIVDAEAALPKKHLVAQNISNGSQAVGDPHPGVSILNFHYSTPPDSVAQNYRLNRVVADDETGFRGTDDLPYRLEGWDFLVAGGAIYSNLDYSFSVSHPDGTLKATTSPGGGGESLRRQLAIAKRFLEAFDLAKMAPHDEIVRGGRPEKGSVRVLAEPGRAYAIYVRGGRRAELKLELPAGRYRAEWTSTLSGKVVQDVQFEHAGGEQTLASPEYQDDIALRILAQ